MNCQKCNTQLTQSSIAAQVTGMGSTDMVAVDIYQCPVCGRLTIVSGDKVLEAASEKTLDHAIYVTSEALSKE